MMNRRHSDPVANDDPPPPYASVADNASLWSRAGSTANFNATVQDDGRIEIDVNTKLVRVVSAARTSLDWQLPLRPLPPDQHAPAHLNIVIQIVGSRGDVQPFIALGNELKKHGHRIRIASHDVFNDFVTSSGLEFYPIGGDPSELMSYMCRNPGLIPKMKTLRAGEITKKRKMIAEMLEGCWASCIQPDESTGLPFVADAIIANPPSFAHIHCAQALGIPLHLMFTMPWTSTKAFPHPLVNLKADKMESGISNQISYAAVEVLTWQGTGDIINRWREERDLEPVPVTEGPFLTNTLQVPTTYCWSDALVPKPADWADHIDVCGFFFRDEPVYDPPEDLRKFLEAGERPIYIGFGSIVAENPEHLTAIVQGAIKQAGVRCIMSKGWSNLGAGIESPDVFLIGDCPHEWLFKRVSAVIHHGGAGTTACGLKYGRPTAIIPFFGDQPFWGNMVAIAGAGPRPIHHKELNVDNLTIAIDFLLKPETADAAELISKQMSGEDGVKMAAASFHRFLPPKSIPCDIIPNAPAAWVYKSKKQTVKLSKLAVEKLVQHEKIHAKKLDLVETRPWRIENRRWDPLTAGISAMLGGVYDAGATLSTIGRQKQPASSSSADSAASGHSSSARAIVSTSKDGTIKLTKAVGALTRTAAVDVPYALANGLHHGPRLYGDQIRHHGPITDWKSGGVVAGKSFVYGMYDGISGVFTEPVKGAREGGVAGTFKGVGYGVGGLYFKASGAIAGLLGYPLQGLYKTIYDSIHTKTKKQVALAKRVEGLWLLKNAEREGSTSLEGLVDAFEKLR